MQMNATYTINTIYAKVFLIKLSFVNYYIQSEYVYLVVMNACIINTYTMQAVEMYAVFIVPPSFM